MASLTLAVSPGPPWVVGRTYEVSVYYSGPPEPPCPLGYPFFPTVHVEYWGGLRQDVQAYAGACDCSTRWGTSCRAFARWTPAYPGRATLWVEAKGLRAELSGEVVLPPWVVPAAVGGAAAALAAASYLLK